MAMKVVAPTVVHVHDVPLRKRDADDVDSLNSDNAALAALGYKQEFKRSFNAIEVFGIGFSVIGLFPSMASVLVYAIPYGGPVALVWGWAVCNVFMVCIALSLAELASAAPTSGGLYYWTWTFASPRWKKLLSWIVGYCNTMGIVAGLASLDWGCAVQLMAAVSISSNMTFIPTTGQLFGVFVALLLCQCVMASLATPVTARLQGFFVVVNLLLCVAFIVALPAATPKELRNTPSFALGGFVNLYSWPNGFAFILSFLAPLWTNGGFDCPIHVSEEVANARTTVPWAIVSAIGSAAILGFAINIVLAFCMGTDIEGIMSSPIGQPMAAILFNSLGQKGVLVFWSFVVLANFFMGCSVLTAASRQVFAFARDGALPFSSVIYRMNLYTQTPVNGVLASAFVSLLLALLSFAGSTASSAIFSICVAGQYIAYSVPVACRFIGGQPWSPGPFSLGRLGLPVGVIAIAWMIFSIVIFVFPTTPNPGAQGMNYMVAVAGGWISFCLLYFYFPVYGGKCWFNGPQATVILQEAGVQSDAVDSTERRADSDDGGRLEKRGRPVYVA